LFGTKAPRLSHVIYERMDSTGTLRQQFAVPFGYDVCFTRGAFDPANPSLVRTLTALEPKRRHRAIVIVDAGVLELNPDLTGAIENYFRSHADRLELVTAPLSFPGGEACKNDPTLLAKLHTTFFEHRIDRQSFVVIVGGGAVLDAVGYAAAAIHRGVRTVRMPTTVLSQNDSGVGVKNGVNAFGAKNYLGTFFPPFAVINDFDLLATLSARDRIAGYAEAVKVALIRDAAFFDWIEGNAPALATGQPEAVAHLVRRCAELHLQHIAEGGDPFELGSAKPLDFGHWSAHKLESLTHHELRHGEAVGIGIGTDSRYSAAIGLLSEAAAARIDAVLRMLGLPVWHEALLLLGPDGKRAVFAGIEDFREHLGGDLTVTMLAAIGKGTEVHALSVERFEAIYRAMELAVAPSARREALGA